jgi:all-trans-retinol 13,14-reductase
MKKYDVVIIGSGLGGLLCGYILCKQGYSVIILEKSPVIGGCLQSFKRNGYLFDTGMHYIGSMEEGQLLNRFWHYFQLYDKIPLRKLDENAFDIISYKGQRYSSAMGYDNYVEHLSEIFPKERKSLNDYVNLLQKIATSSPLSRLEESDNLQPLNTDYVKRSVNEYLDEITSNNTLRSVIAGNLPLYGGIYGKTPFYIHAFIHNSYIQGAYRIVGGCQAIANNLEESIRKMGGIVNTNSKVISLKGIEKVEKAITEDGEIYEGKQYISDIHPKRMIELLDSNLIKRSYCRRIRNTPESIGGFSLYIGFKPNSVPYLNSNFFHYDVDDIWTCADYTINDWPRGYLFMHQPPVDNGNYSNTAVMISYMRYDDVKRWKGTTVEHRGADYEAFKEEHAKRMINKLEEAFPGIKSNIAYYNISTPLTYEDYTGTEEGSMYGMIRDVTSPVQTIVSQQTYISNLYMTGQNTNSHGMLGVTNGALLTCGKLVGLNTIIKSINEI